MKNMQTLTDKAAIALSLLCMLHCFAFPLVLVLLPSIAALQLNSEAFHYWMLFAVIPISLFALTVGCKKHKETRLFVVGVIGVAFLVLAVTFGEAILGELGEKLFTALGAITLTIGHFRNYRLCQKQESCECSSTNDV